MEFLQIRRQRLTRPAMRVRKQQHHASTTEILKRTFRSIETRQPKIRRWCSGPQTIAFNLAARQRSVAEAIGTVISITIRSGRREEIPITFRLFSTTSIILFGASRLIEFPELRLIESLFQL